MTAREAAQAARSGWHRLAPNTRGALWLLLAGLLFSSMSVLVKLMGNRLDSFQIAFFRAGFGLLAILPFAIAAGPATLRTTRPLAHLMRGVIGAGAMFCGFYSIAHLPLADATALSFTNPLFLIVLAAIFLGERVRLRRITATVIGFLGVLIMLRPGGGMQAAALAALGGALLVAIVVVLVKRLTRTEKPVSVLFWFGLISTVVALLPALLVWRQPTAAELLMLMLIGTFGASGQSCMIRGFACGEATAIAPFDYARLIYAGVLGYMVFAEVPDLWTLVGAAVIVASTLYISYREAQLARRAPRRPAAPAEPGAMEAATVPGAASATLVKPPLDHR